MARKLKYSPAFIGDLTDNETHNFAMRHALGIYDSSAVYSFIPKNACSTLRYSLARNNGFITETTDVDWHHSNNYTFCVSQEFASVAQFAFIILRCPFRRIASAFLDKVVTANLVTRSIYPRKHEKVMLRVMGRDMFHSLTFNRFLDRLALIDRAGLNEHWRPQSDFLVYEDYDAYYSVDDFGAFELDIYEKIGFRIYDTRNKIGHDTSQYQKVDGGFSNARAGEIFNMKNQGKLPGYASLFDEAAISKACQLYDDDIHLFADLFGKDALLFPHVIA